MKQIFLIGKLFVISQKKLTGYNKVTGRNAKLYLGLIISIFKTGIPVFFPSYFNNPNILLKSSNK